MTVTYGQRRRKNNGMEYTVSASSYYDDGWGMAANDPHFYVPRFDGHVYFTKRESWIMKCDDGTVFSMWDNNEIEKDETV